MWRSLKRQAYRDAVAWSKSDPGFATLKAHAKVREKVTFIDGFGTGSELVLQSKSKRATNYAESQFTIGTSRRRASDSGSQNARQAGHVAGGKAELQGMIK